MTIDHLQSMGWVFEQRDDLFKTIVVRAPNGFTASLTMLERNPSNVFYILVKDLMNEAERQGKQTPEADNAD